MNRSIRNILLLVPLTVPLLGGCLNLGEKSRPPRHYVLSGIEEEESRAPRPSFDTEIVIRLGPVQLPEYLDRPQIVTRSGENELHLAEFDRWAEPLREGITRVLAQNLSRLIPTEKVILYPLEFPAAETYRIKMEILRFDGKAGEDVRLGARWTVADGRGEAIVPLKESTYKEATGGKSYAATVAALNRTLEKLSRAIAAELRPRLIKR